VNSAGLAPDFDRSIWTDAEICRLFGDSISVNPFLLWRIDKIEPKDGFLLVGQNDVKRVAVIPPLGFVDTAVEALERLRWWCGLRQRHHWQKQHCGENPDAQIGEIQIL